MTPDQLNRLTDKEATDLFESLVSERFGSKRQFAIYCDRRSQTIYQWDRPPLWALLWMTEWKEAQEDRETLDTLAHVVNRRKTDE